MSELVEGDCQRQNDEECRLGDLCAILRRDVLIEDLVALADDAGDDLDAEHRDDQPHELENAEAHNVFNLGFPRGACCREDPWLWKVPASPAAARRSAARSRSLPPA